MFCAQCGTEADPASRRCVKCDTDLTGGHSSAAPSTGEVTMTPPPDAVLTYSPALTSADTLVPGQKFGTRYTIIKKLGVGGMGAVYQAWDDSLGIAVALKVIRVDADTSPEETRQLEARFKRELLLARQVSHPNVVRIHDLGELGELKYLTMAYVDGADLATVMRRERKLPVERALAIFRQITEGLSAAHAAGVVHRDLKPANVMLDADGLALLTDFGIARSLDAETLHTLPGSIVGTLDYMAPEQARGESADHRSDVYSLGLILYELLAGGRPRATGAGGLADLLARVADGPPPLGTVASDVPPALQRIVARCLDRNPQARYASATELLSDLDQLGPDGRLLPTVMTRRPRPSHIAVAALVVLVLGGFAWWMIARPSVPAPAVQREPVSILIADFENRAKDPVFEGALEQALAIGMEGAPFVANYPRAEAVKLARSLRAGGSLDASAAQLVAVREEVGVVLAGSVAQDSGGYLLQVRALRPGTQEPFATLQERATDKAGVLRAIDRLARSLRTALGDTPAVAVSQAESFSAGSLEAVREYTIAQTLSTDRKNDEAIEHYKAAIQHDPQFGRAYAGWAVSAFDLGRRSEAEQLWTKAMSLMDRMSEREKYRTLGGYYIGVARNYDKAIEAYQELVEKYPADLAGHNNLALAYFFTRDFPKALEYGKRAIDVYPHSLKFRNNYALYAMYAGDFKTAAENAQQVLQEDPKYDAAYLPLAMAALSEGDVGKARDVYAKARESGAAGASLAAIGLADIALYEGKPEEAVTILEGAIPADRQARNTLGAASKTVALAEARAASAGAVEGARLIADLAAESSDESVLVPAARLLGAARQDRRAVQLSLRLDERTQPVPRAYARIIAGEVAMRQRHYSDAINEFSTAVKAADLWLARFDLGVAYVEAGRYAEAISELDGCVKRRGEATALFFDDVPTYRYAAVLPYWLGRAQQGLGMGGAAASFEQFLRIRAGATTDPLVVDARKRLDSLASTAAPR
jgi:serine/threonine protein kinase/tetratricopeptide (TPR) repeat protein